MVVSTEASRDGQAQGYLRPMDPTRDLGAIADLIEEAFAQEIDERGRAAIREMRWMARLTPLVWWWSQADPAFQDTFNGFVWEEPAPGGGKLIVGNVSLNRTPGSHQRRIVCNVVVQKEYQGRGLGRRLTEAAVSQAQTSGAEGVVIQVHQDNLRAHRLYSDLGFREATRDSDFQLAAVEPDSPKEAPGYHVRPWQPSDGRSVYELARLVTPAPLNWIRPVRPGSYQPGWWTRLGQRATDLFKQQHLHRLVVLHEAQLVAMLSVVASLREGAHQLEMLVHPEHRGKVEHALVSQALDLLPAAPSRPVQTTVLADHTTALDALHDNGFEEKRTLLTLRKDFRRRG